VERIESIDEKERAEKISGITVEWVEPKKP
jgi:hypothetical protein